MIGFDVNKYCNCGLHIIQEYRQVFSKCSPKCTNLHKI